jgi:rod shape-determining protein MreC
MPRLFGKKSSAGLCLIIILLIAGHSLGWLNWLENLIGQATRPTINALAKNNQSISNWLSAWQQRQSCQDQLRQAQTKINELTIQTVGLASLTKENQDLRQLLNFQQARNFKLVKANIIYRGQSGGLLAPSQTLIIDQGSRQGIAVNFAVIDQQGVIIGKIGQIKADSAEVLLVTNKNCLLAVGTASSSRTIGVVRGDLGLTIRLEMVAQDEQLPKGGAIITSGLEPAVPKDLLIGWISQINKENNALWQDAGVEPAADPNQLSFVSVIIP